MEKISNLIQIMACHNLNYKTISLQCVEDVSLSWKAKGIQEYLISRPIGWNLNSKDLLNRSTDGSDSMYSGIKELINAKYLFRIVLRENGKIKKYGYLVFEKPQLSIEQIKKYLPDNWFIDAENLHTGNLHTGNPAHNKEQYSNKEQNDNINILSLERIRRKCSDDLVQRITDENKLPVKAGLKIKRLEPYQFIKNPTVKEIFTYWNQLGKPLPKHKINTTKTFTKTCKQIEKTLSTNSKEKIIAAMTTYSALVQAPWFKFSHRASGVIVGLMDFLSVSAGLNARMYQHNPDLKIRSWFLECRNCTLSTLQQKYSKLVDDKYPEVTIALKRNWCKLIDNKNEFSIEEENTFRKAAKLLYNYSINLKDFKSDRNHKKKHPVTLAVFVVQAFTQNNKQIIGVPYWIASNNFFNNTVTQYLMKIGYVEKGYDKHVATKKLYNQQNQQNVFTPIPQNNHEDALSADDFIC